MNEPDFWTRYAEAMELSIEGNRLIAQEIADLAGRLWHRIVRACESYMLNQPTHMPPV